ncbi:MAG: glutamyl-tRNA reductase [Thermodesulfobacteriota bacterium]
MSVEQIVVLGVNHKTAPVAVREKLTFPDIEVPLSQLAATPNCREFCFLSTCNRVEVIFTTAAVDKGAKEVRALLFGASEISDSEAKEYTYLHQGEAAIRHLFRVGASLDSMVVGEPQILGQLKEAYRQATARKCTGVILNKLIHKAFSTAKRVRSETNIGSSAVSISYAAVQLARKIFGRLKGKKVLLAGAGEMAELAAEHLLTQGCTEVIVANRTLERGVKLAKSFGGKAVPLSDLEEQLAMVDIMVSSTGAPDLILTKSQVKPIMKRRRSRPLFFIDIAVPRDLDPEINELDNVYLYDVDDLSQVVEMNKNERQQEATRAERIVAEECAKLLAWLDNMALTPTISALRRKAEEIRLAEVQRSVGRMDLSESEKKSINKMTSAIINKLLHHPLLYLKEEECNPEERQRKLAEMRRVFGLDEG